MTDCYYCYRPILDGQELSALGDDHYVCVQEWKRRDDAGLCVKCGKNKRADHCNGKCTNCTTNYSRYIGYEGPQS